MPATYSHKYDDVGGLQCADSVIRRIIDNKRIYILKEEVGTDPSFYYFFD